MTMTSILDFISKIGPLLTFVAALIAARIAWNFGQIQADIARTQAATAARAAATARNRLRFDLFDERLKFYNIVTSYMEAHYSRECWKVDTSPYLRAVSGAKWLFNDTVNDWIYKELADAVMLVRMAQATCEGIEPGPAKVEKLMAVQSAIQGLDAQYKRRDEVFRPFLHLTDE